MEVRLPIRTHSVLNAREHWAARAKRTAKERVAASLVLALEQPPTLPVVVTFVRVAPRKLDTDNLAASFKAVRDQTAVWLGLPLNKRGHAEDSDPRVTWKYEQRREGPGVYAVIVQVEERKDEA